MKWACDDVSWLGDTREDLLWAYCIKTWYLKLFEHLEDEMAGWHHWLDGRESSELRKLVMDGEAWRAAILGVAKSRTGLSDWTELNILTSRRIKATWWGRLRQKDKKPTWISDDMVESCKSNPKISPLSKFLVCGVINFFTTHAPWEAQIILLPVFRGLTA